MQQLTICDLKLLKPEKIAIIRHFQDASLWEVARCDDRETRLELIRRQGQGGGGNKVEVEVETRLELIRCQGQGGESGEHRGGESTLGNRDLGETSRGNLPQEEFV